MTKQEKIQESYGKFYDEMKSWIDENGWFNKNAFYQKEFIFLKYEKIDLLFHHKGDFMIPISIKEIENNYGWIKIESESDLPKTPDFYWCRDNNGAIHQIYYEDITVGYSTHYQPIVKPREPLY